MLLRNIFFMSRSTDPTDIILSNNTIDEDAEVGDTIGTLTTIDENINDTFTYSIETDVDGKFIIDGNALKLDDTLNYLEHATHSVTIRSTDNKGRYYTKEFTIEVNQTVIPWDITNLGSDALAFYDMNTGVTDAGSGKVSAWNDFLGTTERHLAQGTDANRPTLTENGIYFDGSNDNLFNANPFMTNSTNGVIVIAIISAPPSLVGNSEWILCEASSSSTNPHLVILGKDSGSTDLTKDTQQLRNDAFNVITPYGLNPSADDAYDDSFKILTKKFDKINNEISLRINGVAGSNPVSFTPSGTFTLDRFSLGALVRGATLNYSKFTLKGLAIIDASVGNDNELRVEGYMAHKFGLSANLPVDHPYKNSAPTI